MTEEKLPSYSPNFPMVINYLQAFFYLSALMLIFEVYYGIANKFEKIGEIESLIPESFKSKVNK